MFSIYSVEFIFAFIWGKNDCGEFSGISLPHLLLAMFLHLGVEYKVQHRPQEGGGSGLKQKYLVRFDSDFSHQSQRTSSPSRSWSTAPRGTLGRRWSSSRSGRSRSGPLQRIKVVNTIKEKIEPLLNILTWDCRSQCPSNALSSRALSRLASTSGPPVSEDEVRK